MVRHCLWTNISLQEKTIDDHSLIDRAETTFNIVICFREKLTGSLLLSILSKRTFLTKSTVSDICIFRLYRPDERITFYVNISLYFKYRFCMVEQSVNFNYFSGNEILGKYYTLLHHWAYIVWYSKYFTSKNYKKS